MGLGASREEKQKADKQWLEEISFRYRINKMKTLFSELENSPLINGFKHEMTRRLFEDLFQEVCNVFELLPCSLFFFCYLNPGILERVQMKIVAILIHLDYLRHKLENSEIDRHELDIFRIHLSQLEELYPLEYLDTVEEVDSPGNSANDKIVENSNRSASNQAFSTDDEKGLEKEAEDETETFEEKFQRKKEELRLAEEEKNRLHEEKMHEIRRRRAEMEDEINNFRLV